MVSIVAQITDHRDHNGTFSCLQSLLTVFTGTYPGSYTGQAVTLNELYTVLRAYGLQRMNPCRGDFLAMASSVLDYFDAMQKLQFTADMFFRTLELMRVSVDGGPEPVTE